VFKKTFSKGTYYIGDPCYVVSDDNWDKLLDNTDFFQNEDQSYKGYQILAGDTAYGDGTYTDNYRREYGVDAGLIGIFPIEAVDNKYGNVEELGSIVEFEEDFVVEINNGVFKFGNIIINTFDEDDDYYIVE
jgi:hypothetical protein